MRIYVSNGVQDMITKSKLARLTSYSSHPPKSRCAIHSGRPCLCTRSSCIRCGTGRPSPAAYSALLRAVSWRCQPRRQRRRTSSAASSHRLGRGRWGWCTNIHIICREWARGREEGREGGREGGGGGERSHRTEENALEHLPILLDGSVDIPARYVSEW